MLIKLTKVMNIVYLLTAMALLLLTACFMTQYTRLKYEEVTSYFSQCNNMLLILLVILVVGIVIYNILGNGYRKKMYVSNVIIGTILPLVCIIYSIFVILKIQGCVDLLNSDPSQFAGYVASTDEGRTTYEVILEYLKTTPDVPFPFNYFTLDFSVGFMIVFIVIMALQMVYTILKFFKTYDGFKKNGGVVDAK